MPQDTTFRTIVIIVVILIIAILGMIYFVALPQWSAYSQAKSQLTAAQKVSEENKLAQDQLDNFLNAFKLHQTDVAEVSLALPLKSSDLTNYTAVLGAVAQSSGVVLSNFMIQESTAPTTKAVVSNLIQPVSISLDASGSFASFKDFVLHLENSLRITDVSHVSLKADQNGVLKYQISLQTYYQQ